MDNPGLKNILDFLFNLENETDLFTDHPEYKKIVSKEIQYLFPNLTPETLNYFNFGTRLIINTMSIFLGFDLFKQTDFMTPKRQKEYFYEIITWPLPFIDFQVLFQNQFKIKTFHDYASYTNYFKDHVDFTVNNYFRNVYLACRTIMKYQYNLYPNWYDVFPIPADLFYVEFEASTRNLTLQFDFRRLKPNTEKEDYEFFSSIISNNLNSQNNINISPEFINIEKFVPKLKKTPYNELTPSLKEFFKDITHRLSYLCEEWENPNNNNLTELYQQLTEFILGRKFILNNFVNQYPDKTEYRIQDVLINAFQRGTFTVYLQPSENLDDPQIRQNIIKRMWKLCKSSYYFLTGNPYHTIKKNFLKETYKFSGIYGLSLMAQLKFWTVYDNSCIMLLTGGTGVGKSTQIPKLTLYGSLLNNHNSQTIVSTQPRIKATENNANFIAKQLSVEKALNLNDHCKDFWVPVLPTSNKDYSIKLKYIPWVPYQRGSSYVGSSYVGSFSIEKEQTGNRSPFIYGIFNSNDKLVVTDQLAHIQYQHQKTEGLNHYNNDLLTPIFKEETDGILISDLTRINRADIEFNYNTVLIDESHEHNANMDLILTLLNAYIHNYTSDIEPIKKNNNSDFNVPKKIQKFKLIIVSATMEDDEPRYRQFFKVSQLRSPFNTNIPSLDNRVHISIPYHDTTYEIKEYWQKTILTLEEKINFIAQTIEEADKQNILKDILIFQPGQGEIKDFMLRLSNKMKNNNFQFVPFTSKISNILAQLISSLGESNPEIPKLLSVGNNPETLETLLLNNELTIEDLTELHKQNGAVAKHFIIVATNIAEASLTISSLTHVFDDGEQKVNIYDYYNQVLNLQITKISDLQRKQRKGRVGRTANGYAYMMYPRDYLNGVKQKFKICIDNAIPLIKNILYSSFNPKSKSLQIIGFDIKTLNDEQGKFYLVHPNELFITRDSQSGIIIDSQRNFNIPNLLKAEFSNYLSLDPIPRTLNLTIVKNERLHILEKIIIDLKIQNVPQSYQYADILFLSAFNLKLFNIALIAVITLIYLTIEQRPVLERFNKPLSLTKYLIKYYQKYENEINKLKEVTELLKNLENIEKLQKHIFKITEKYEFQKIYKKIFYSIDNSYHFKFNQYDFIDFIIQTTFINKIFKINSGGSGLPDPRSPGSSSSGPGNWVQAFKFINPEDIREKNKPPPQDFIFRLSDKPLEQITGSYMFSIVPISILSKTTAVNKLEPERINLLSFCFSVSYPIIKYIRQEFQNVQNRFSAD